MRAEDMPVRAEPAAPRAAPSLPVGAAAQDRFAVPVEAPARAEPVLPATSAFDVPLEPGSGRPRPEPAAATAQDPQSVRQSLIAAARRSARAASEAAAATPAPGAEAPAKGPGRFKEMLEKRKRPLLLGLAALILALGTAHLVTNSLLGSEVRSPIAPPAATQPEAPAEPAPLPAKDQSSALPAEPPQGGAQPAAGDAVPERPVAAVTAESAPVAAPAPTEQVQPVTGIGELPAGFGSAGLRKAALDGDARAVYELASRAADGPAAQRDAKLALRLFERAAAAGLAPAQFRVGNMFEKGIGAQRDLSLARIWYQRAAERGNAKAMHNLAVLHAEGAAGKPDYATATDWFRRAAEFGVRDSQYNLAVLLGRGLGAPIDLSQSFVWFSVAAGQGDEDAARKRDEVAQRLKPEELAAAKALAANWKPRALDAAANEVTPPAKGWDPVPTAAATRPAKASRI
jgi:localization factor PodJL